MNLKVYILIVSLNSVHSQLINQINSVLDYGLDNSIQDLNFVLGVVIAKVAWTVNSLLIESIDDLLDYGLLNGIVNINYAFGAVFAKGQLELLEENITHGHLEQAIKKLKQKCDIVIERAKTNIEQKDELTHLLQPKLWKVDFCHKPDQHNSALPDTLPPTSIQGPELTEVLSDSCFRLLFPGCRVTEECILAEITDDVAGYGTTHQVLYWTVFKQGCTTEIINSTIIDDIIQHKCGMILEEHNYIEEKGLYAYYRDIYFEQKLVCGMLGFSEFLKYHHIMDLISSLQLPKGCFSYYTHSENRKRKCDDHMSGVMLGVLGLFMKLHYCC